MSESVKIGGIGKNPVIDKINEVHAMDALEYAAKRMEKLLIVTSPQISEIPLHFPTDKISESRG